MSDDLTNQPTAPIAADPASPPIAPGAEPTAQAILGTPTPAQPTAVPGRRREVAPTPVTVETTPEVVNPAAPETSPAPEAERSAELGPELEKFVEQAEKQTAKQPAETVVAAETMPTTVPKTTKQPVVILPLTQKNLQGGKGKGPQMSIRWLAEWCIRQIKKFSSILVVYRENE